MMEPSTFWAADALTSIGNVKRLDCKSRFITNLRTPEEVDTKTGVLLVIYSVSPWNALSVSSSGRPTLLVNDKLRDDQKQYLETTNFDRIGCTKDNPWLSQGLSLVQPIKTTT